MTFRIPVCAACAAAVFPPRLLCPRCGGAEWREEAVEQGVLEGRTERNGTGIGAVRTPLGPVVVVRLEGEAAAGDTVSLDDENGVPTARAS